MTFITTDFICKEKSGTITKIKLGENRRKCVKKQPTF